MSTSYRADRLGQPVAAPPGVSYVVPVRNGAPWIRDVLGAIDRQTYAGPAEVIVVDDGSTDGSDRVLEALRLGRPLRVLSGGGRGAAAALNAGIRAARFPVVCQVDQDVVIEPDWTARLVAALSEPDVAAVQGYYATDPRSSLWARATALDLELRYAALDDTDHVCTGNTVYRRDAVHAVGGFDERLGYGYDNDMSYRLCAAGYRLALCREARSVHRWREGFRSYCRQQYGFGYGRIDLVARYPRRITGDAVSPVLMMLHPLVMGAAVLGLLAAGALAAVGGPWQHAATGAAAMAAVLAAERALAGARAWQRFGDPAALLFPVLHAARDLAWVAAIAVWLSRRVRGRVSRPSDSMRPRPAGRSALPLSRPRRLPDPTACDPAAARAPRRVLALVPAHNEAANLPSVIAEIRACCPALDILIVDDGSTDDTAAVLPTTGARWLRLPERMGLGSAIRAGLRYASRAGYDGVVRVDGDGQHCPADIDRLLAPLFDRRADVVLGSRFIERSGVERRHRPEPGLLRPMLRVLAGCLSALTGRPVTDPTSGFCAFGPEAVRLLADHHPTGYPEPELQLFLSRNSLRVAEVPVRARARLGGRTSLTPPRVAAAAARVLLALVIEPVRASVRSAP